MSTGVDPGVVGGRMEAHGAEARGSRGCPRPHRGSDLGVECAPPPKLKKIAQKGVLVHSGTDRTYFWSAWRIDFLAISRLRGVGAVAPPVDPPLHVDQFGRFRRAHEKGQHTQTDKTDHATPSVAIYCKISLQCGLRVTTLPVLGYIWKKVPDTTEGPGL